MSKFIKYTEVGKTDLRLHPGQVIRYDISNEIALIAFIASGTDGFDTSYPEGYYMAGSDEPVLLKGNDYFIKDPDTGVMKPIKNLRNVNSDIYTPDGERVLKQREIKKLKITPTCNPKVSAMVKYFVIDEAECILHKTTLATIDDLIYSFILSKDIDFRSEDVTIPEDVEKTMWEIVDLLDSKISDIVRSVAYANPNMVFDIELVDGMLSFIAVNDWRVIEYEKIMKEREMTQLMKEQGVLGSAWDSQDTD